MITMLLSAAAAAALLSPLPQDIARGPTTVDYQVTATTVEAGENGVIPLQVTMRVAEPPRPRVVFQIPVWTPGSYHLQDFPGRIHDLRATDGDGAALELLRLARDRWQVRHRDKRAVQLSYRVDLTPRDRFMMGDRGRRCLTYQGPGVYLFVRGAKDAPCRVRFALPDGWSVASGLVDCGDGSYFAQDYDFLADCPVKLGRFERYRFRSHGVPFDVVVDSPEKFEFDAEPWVANIAKIADCEGRIFGGFPFDRYAFLYTVSPRGNGGGLEHLTSTAIGLSTRGLQRSATSGMGVTAHEFFHLWNVKRIRPRALGPFDYGRPNRTTALWLSEGVTSYYGEVAQARCGLHGADDFWRAMARQIQTLESNPARHHVSSAQSSYRIWDPQPRDRTLSYYNSGLVLGLLLDLEIRARTGNQRSLDDVMRELLRLCQDRGRGFDDGELVTLVGQVAGADFGEWFDRYVYGTVVPPYAEILAHAGMQYHEQRKTERVVRGLLAVGRDRPPFYLDPDATSGRRLLRAMGTVVRAGGAAVTSADDVLAAATGDVVRLELEAPTGRQAAVDAEVEQVDRVRVELAPDPAADEAAVAIRTGITKPQG